MCVPEKHLVVQKPDCMGITMLLLLLLHTLKL
jgi:hypothetical protein